MSLNLPAPIDQALLNQRVQAWADAILASFVISNHGSRHVHAFVDPTTGDVFKAAGWKAPAKGVRYNLVDDTSYQAMLARCESSGGYLYR